MSVRASLPRSYLIHFLVSLFISATSIGQDFPIIEPPRPAIYTPMPVSENSLTRLLNTKNFASIGNELGQSYRSILREYNFLGEPRSTTNGGRAPAYIRIHEREAVKQLKLSSAQVDRLRRVGFLQLAHMYRHADIPAEKQKLEEWSADLKARYQAQWKVSNEEVAEILSDEQLNRLRQIAFQTHTLRYPNLQAALSQYGQQIDQKKSHEISTRLAQTKMKVRGLTHHLSRLYAVQALRIVLGQSKVRALVGTPLFSRSKFDKEMWALLEDDEQPESILGKDEPQTLKFDDVANRQGMDDWIMHNNSSLSEYLIRIKDRILLTDEQLDKLKSLKPLPDRSSFEYSYVVAKTGLTEPNFKDPVAVKSAMSASMSARDEYAKLKLKHKADVAKLLTQEQRDQVRQLEITNRALQTVPFRILDFYGVELTPGQRAELQAEYEAIPERVRDRMFELRVVLARDELKKHIGTEELERMMGEPFRPIIDKDRGHIGLEDSLRFQKELRNRRTGPRRGR